MNEDQQPRPHYRHSPSRLRPIHVDSLRPMLPLSMMLAAGQWLGTRAWPAMILLLLVLLLVFLIRTCFSFRLRHFSWLLIVCLAGGFFIQFYRHRPAQQEAAVFAAQTGSQDFYSASPPPISIEGRVVSLPGSHHRFATVIIRRRGGRYIALRGPAESLVYGSTIRVLADVSLPQQARNPGGFDQAAWLRGKAVYLSAQTADNEPVKQVKPAFVFSFKVWGEKQRLRLAQVTSQHLSEKQNALLTALLFGERQQMSLNDQALFRKAGLAHLMAVSGTHLSLLILPVDKGLKLSRLRRRRRILVLLLILFLYGCLTGWPVSLSRAVIMNAAVLWGRFLLRPADALNALSLAAFILLAARPDTILSIGFWLSLLASGSLIVGVRPLAKKLRSYLPFLSENTAFMLAAPFCVQLATLPMTLSLSGEMTWIGFFINLPASFLVQMIILSALAALPVATLAHSGLILFAPLGRILFMPLAAFLNLLDVLASVFGRMMLPRLQEGFFQPLVWLFLVWLILYCSGVLPSFLQFFNLSAERSRRLWLRGQLILTGALVMFYLIHIGLQPPFTVWFFDVGQGDAILLKNRGGQQVMIDGGPSGSGYRVLLPAMDALAINQIDLAIATHGHDDHLGGLIDLIEMKRIKKLAFPDGLIVQKDYLNHHESASASESFLMTAKEALPADQWQVVQSRDEGSDLLIQRALDAASEADILVQTLQSRDTIQFNQETVMTVFFPEAQTDTAFAARWLNRPVEDGNTLSLQILAQVFDFRLLLTGDCTGEAEQALVRQGTWPDTDLLKVAHHGSARTTKMPFLEQTRPQAAIIMVGAYNRYGHPAPGVLDNLQAVDCAIWRTDLHGAIRWQIWPSGWDLSAMAGTPQRQQSLTR